MTKEDVKNIVEEVVSPRFEKIDKQFEKIDKQFEKIDKQFEGIDKQFEGIDKKMDIRFKTEFKKQEERIDKKLDEHVSRMAGIMQEEFLHQFDLLKEYFDGKDEKTNRRIDKLEKEKVDRNWDLLLRHDRILNKA